MENINSIAPENVTLTSSASAQFAGKIIERVKTRIAQEKIDDISGFGDHINHTEHESTHSNTIGK